MNQQPTEPVSNKCVFGGTGRVGMATGRPRDQTVFRKQWQVGPGGRMRNSSLLWSDVAEY